MTMSLYYADPDGTQCELQVDVMDEATAAASWQATYSPPIRLVCRLTRTTWFFGGMLESH